MRLVAREMLPYCASNTPTEAIFGVPESVVKLKYRPNERYCGAACPATAVKYPSLSIDCECMVVPSAVSYFDWEARLQDGQQAKQEKLTHDGYVVF